MKSISFILGFLILALALKPCADGFCSDHEDETEVCVSHSCDADTDETHHEDDYTDDCAMLCVCNCCGVLVLHQEPPIFSLHSKISISTSINSQYESHYRFDLLFAIWQPPQVVS